MSIQHNSMKYGLSDSKHQQDCDTAFNHAKSVGNVFITGTEAGGNSGKLPQQIKDTASKNGWWAYVHGSGEWVCFDKSYAEHVDHGWVGPVIPARGKPYGHQARGIAWVTVKPKAGGPNVTVGVIHFLTKNSEDHEPKGYSNKNLQDAALKFCKDKGSGNAVVFVNADVNIDDVNKNVWGTGDIITCWDELKKYPDTHGKQTIDVISRYKADNGKFTKATAYPDSKVKMNTDHNLIEATVNLGG